MGADALIGPLCALAGALAKTGVDAWRDARRLRVDQAVAKASAEWELEDLQRNLASLAGRLNTVEQIGTTERAELRHFVDDVRIAVAALQGALLKRR